MPPHVNTPKNNIRNIAIRKSGIALRKELSPEIIGSYQVSLRYAAIAPNTVPTIKDNSNPDPTVKSVHGKRAAMISVTLTPGDRKEDPKT